MAEKLNVLQRELLLTAYNQMPMTLRRKLDLGLADEYLRQRYGHTRVTRKVARALCCREGMADYLRRYLPDAGDYTTVGVLLDSLNRMDGLERTGRQRRGAFVYAAILAGIIYEHTMLDQAYSVDTSLTVGWAFSVARFVNDLTAELTAACERTEKGV